MRRFNQRRQASGRNLRVRSARRMGMPPSSGQGVTVQHDTRRIYSKKSMPRRKKRAWKRFSRKVNAVSERDLGSRTIVFNGTSVATNTASTNHILQHVALYSNKCTVVGTPYLNDLKNISDFENAGDPSAASGGTVDSTSKYIFKSGILDITFRNSSTLNLAGVQTLDSRGKLEIDVYEMYMGKRSEDVDDIYDSIGECFSKGDAISKRIGGAGTSVDLGLRGVTPWDIPAALSYFKFKILKKTKYFVNNGDTFTYQVRDPKRRVALQETMEKFSGFNRVGWTRNILIIAKLVPGLTVGTGIGEWTESLTVGQTRKYLYKIEGFNEDRDRYVSQ